MTGIYALQGQTQLVPTYLLCCGLTDLTKAQTLLSWSKQNTCRVLFPLAAGTTTTVALTDIQSAAIADKRFIWLKDWVQWSDPVSGKLLFNDPGGIAIGACGSLSPQLSPLNKPVNAVVSTEFYPNGYPAVEIGLLQSAGFLVISPWIPSGNQMGFITGNTTSANLDEQPIEYARLMDWVGQQGNNINGQFVGQDQGVNDPDPVRDACTTALNNMFFRMQQAGLIDKSVPGSPAYLVLCNSTLNPPTSIRARYMIANVWYRPLGAIDYVLVNLYASITNTAPFA
jgi:hypothetical protein